MTKKKVNTSIVDNYISNQFKKLRLAYGFTQQEIADMLNCSRINVIRMERAQNGFTASNIFKLCAIFQCSPDDLFPAVKRGNEYTKKAKSILKNKNKQ